MGQSEMTEPHNGRRRLLVDLGAALGAVLVATLLRIALAPLVGTAVPFISFFVAALLLAWYRGVFSAALCILLSDFAATNFILEPERPGLFPATRIAWAAAIGFSILAGTVSLLLHLLRTALGRSKAAENAEREQRRWFEATLASIGDAVITTDLDGRILHANRVAQSLLGWAEAVVTGRPLDEVFRIVDATTGENVSSPVARILQEGVVVSMGKNSVLIARDGSKIPVE